MARRYGKVTVTGWIEEVAGEWMVFYAKEGICSLLGSASRPIFHLAEHSAVVEFLPEPVVFKDGDALREQCNGHVWSRSNGHWMSTLSNHVFRDSEMELFLRSGGWVRLVAEGATDAG